MGDTPISLSTIQANLAIFKYFSIPSRQNNCVGTPIMQSNEFNMTLFSAGIR